MTQDKAFLVFRGTILLEHVLVVAREVTAEVRIVGSAEKFAAFANSVQDRFVGCGPLGGIHAALSASNYDYNLMLAVDMPFLEARFLTYLLGQARLSNAIVTVPRGEQGWQPLCAVYRREFVSLAESALRAGHNRIDPLFSDILLRVIDQREMLEQGFSCEIFRNLNTPEEFERAVLIKKN